MQWSRVKSIFIVILLVIDGFLLFNIAQKYVSRHYRETENAHNIIEILNLRGIQTGPDFSLPKAHVLPVLQADRSRAEEERFTCGLLGEEAIGEERAGSSAVTYTTARGTIEWREGGVVSGAFTPPSYTQPETGEQMRGQAQALLAGAGMPVSNLTFAVQDQTVTVTFPTAGVPVFNRALHFTFGAEQVALSGMWMFDMPYITKSGNYVTFEAVDAIFPLISSADLSQVWHMEQGFLLSESGSGRVQMTPGWRIDTNAGSFFVDSLKKTAVLL